MLISKSWVIKIRIKNILFGLVLIVLIAQTVNAATGMLEITGVDVKVDSKSETDLQNNDIIGREAKPGSTVTIKPILINNYADDSSGLEIRDISVTITIEGIDEDGDDLEEEIDEFDLDPQDDKKVSAKFEVPLRVSDDTYTVRIKAEGRDANRTTQTVEWTLDFEVKKANHNVIIQTAELDPSTVECNRATALNLELMNLGKDQEEEIKYTVDSSALGLSFTEKDITMSEDPDDDDYTYQKTISFNIADAIKAGTYPITIKTYYDTTKLSNTKSVDLTVAECKVVIEPPKEDVKEEEETPEVVVGEKDDTTTAEIITPPTTPTVTQETQKSFYDSNTFVAILIGAEIIAVLIGIILVVKILKR